MISGGRLRFRATIQRNTSNVDNVGKKTQTFSTIGTFRCDVVDISASEIVYADGATPLRVYELYARWDAIAQHSMTERDRLSVALGDRTLTLNVSGIRDSMMKGRLAIITCEEVLA